MCLLIVWCVYYLVIVLRHCLVCLLLGTASTAFSKGTAPTQQLFEHEQCAPHVHRMVEFLYYLSTSMHSPSKPQWGSIMLLVRGMCFCDFFFLICLHRNQMPLCMCCARPTCRSQAPLDINPAVTARQSSTGLLGFIGNHPEEGCDHEPCLGGGKTCCR